MAFPLGHTTFDERSTMGQTIELFVGLRRPARSRENMALNENLAHPPKRGMVVRSREVLEPGLNLFKLGHRFVKDSRQTDWDMVASAWWLTEGSAALISAHDDLSDAFRRAGAIARRWGGSADHVVKVRTRFSLVAFIGPGTIQDLREDKGCAGDLPLWVPSPSTAQLYVPLQGGRESISPKVVFSNVFVVPIDKWDSAYVHGSPPPRWQIA